MYDTEIWFDNKRRLHNCTWVIINQEEDLREYRIRQNKKYTNWYTNVWINEDVVMYSEDRVFVLTVNPFKKEYRYIDVTDVWLEKSDDANPWHHVLTMLYTFQRSLDQNADPELFTWVYVSISNDHIWFDWNIHPQDWINYLSRQEFLKYIFNPTSATEGTVEDQPINYLYLLSE